jgi:site-specific DNA-methyltransferase (cytosine-N4-specific)
MKGLLKNGYRAKLRPSGHDISEKFSIDNGAAIPPNLIAVANTESNSSYLRLCEENDLKPHPARFPAEIPEYFVRMLTDKADLVLDPFAGSCVTGEVAERLHRHWICADDVEDYLRGAVFRFGNRAVVRPKKSTSYALAHPAALWNGSADDIPLSPDGGRTRPPKPT